MKIKNHILKNDPELCQKILANLLDQYTNPAFGSLPKKEVDLLMLGAIEDVGFVNQDSSLYELVSKLRITRVKARNLIYDRELRRLNTHDLDARVREALKQPLMQKQGELFVLELENPLVIDHLRAKLQSLGYASDGSFSPSLVKLTLDAFAALIESDFTKAEQQKIRKVLIAAGAPDTSFQGVVKSTIRAIAKKVAQDTGDALVERASDYIAPIVEGATENAKELFATVFEGITELEPEPA